MGAAAFQQGQVVNLSGARYALTRKVEANIWQLQDVRSHRIIEQNDDQLRAAYAEGQLVFHNDARPITEIGTSYRHVTPEKMEIARMRREYARAILDYPGTSDMILPIVERVWQKVQSPKAMPGLRTVLRWKSTYVKHDRDILSLVPSDVQKGNHGNRFNDHLLKIMEQAIDEIYMTRNKGTLQATTERAIFLTAAENKLRPAPTKLPYPTTRMIKRLVDSIPAKERCIAREGQTVAMRKFRSVQGHRFTERPLQRAEIDHTLMDLFVVDEENALSLGRPWLTICIDDNSRNVLGMHISFTPPSYQTVAKCLRHAFLPKTNLHSLFPEIKHKWDAHGIMYQLVVDNGAEFHSEGLENACFSLGIEMHYSPRKSPWHKGKVERFIRTLQDNLIHSIPGTTFSNIFEKGDYNPKQHAVIGLKALTRIVTMWIVDYYQQKPHRSLQATPTEVWRSRISIDEISVPENPADLDVILGNSETRVLTHKGIEYKGLLYNSPELAKLRERHGEKLTVELRVDNSNLEKIIVISPDKKRIFTVHALNRAYATNLTLWQHEVIKRYAREHLNSLDPLTWIEAKERIRELIMEEMKFTKKMRVAARRYLGTGEDTNPIPTKSKVDKKAATTPPEPAVEQVMPEATEAQFAAQKQFKAVVRSRASGNTKTNNTKE